MAAVIPIDETVFGNTPLPLELVKKIMKLADPCSHIITKNFRGNGICIYNFNILKIVRTIGNIKILHLSVSKCKKYIVGSNETSVNIWHLRNLDFFQSIDVEFEPIYDPVRDGNFRTIGSEGNGEPVHTFTIDNKLLVACGSKIRSFYLNNNVWIEEHYYNLPGNKKTIVCITSNLSNNMFACGDLSGDVYIFDINTKTTISFTTRVALMRSDHYPEITSLAFNNNKLIVSSIGTNNLLYDMNTNTLIKIEQPPMQFYGSYFNVNNYMFTPCFTKFIGTFHTGTFMWDATTGKVIKKLNMFLQTECSFTPFATKIVTNGRRNGLEVFDWNE
jgi:WD40 repeat protein